MANEFGLQRKQEENKMLFDYLKGNSLSQFSFYSSHEYQNIVGIYKGYGWL